MGKQFKVEFLLKAKLKTSHRFVVEEKCQHFFYKTKWGKNWQDTQLPINLNFKVHANDNLMFSSAAKLR